jgi:hypothetical protein
VIVAFARQIRARREDQPAHGGAEHAAGHGIDWVDLFLGAMLAVEVWAHWHESGHVKRPTVLLAVAMVVIGLLHGRIAAFGARRNALRIDDTGVDVGGKPFRRFKASWDQLEAAEIDTEQARLVRRDGKTRTIDLRDLRNAADVRAALEGVHLRIAPRPAPGDAATPPAGDAATSPADAARPVRI